MDDFNNVLPKIYFTCVACCVDGPFADSCPLPELSVTLVFLRAISEIREKQERLQYTVELQWLEHRWLVYYGCFKLVLESLRTKSHSCRSGIIQVVFSFILKMVYCVYSLKLPR